MVKKYFFITIILTLFLLAGCSNVDLSEVSDEDLERISEKAVVCNEPYIRVGVECCLDKDNNNICDRDEELVESTIFNELEDADQDVEEILVENIETVENELFSYVKLENEENEVRVYVSSNYDQIVEMESKLILNGGDLCGVGRGLIFPGKESVIKFENCALLGKEGEIFIEINSDLWNEIIKYQFSYSENISEEFNLENYLLIKYEDTSEYNLKEISSNYEKKSFGYYVEKNFSLRNINTIGIVPGVISLDIDGSEDSVVYLGNIKVFDTEGNRLSSTYFKENTIIETEISKPLLPGFEYNFLISYEIFKK